jgi:hypothetical protein
MLARSRILWKSMARAEKVVVVVGGRLRRIGNGRGARWDWVRRNVGGQQQQRER